MITLNKAGNSCKGNPAYLFSLIVKVVIAKDLKKYNKGWGEGSVQESTLVNRQTRLKTLPSCNFVGGW